jgi:hypothetical protein
MRIISNSAIVITLLNLPFYGYAAASPNNEYVAISAYLGGRVANDLDIETNQDARISNDFAQALAVNWYYGRNQETELFFSNSKHTLSLTDGTKNASTDIYFSYLHFGGKVLFPTEGALLTSVGLGIGATFFLPDESKYDKDIALSGNINAGLRYELNPQWALRGDIRLYGTVLNSNNSFFCSNEGCLVKVQGEVYVETELMTGIEYKF